MTKIFTFFQYFYNIHKSLISILKRYDQIFLHTFDFSVNFKKSYKIFILISLLLVGKVYITLEVSVLYSH